MAIVVPVNTMTAIMAPDSAMTDRRQRHLLLPGLWGEARGYDAVRDAEKGELDRERIRLWYVASTRARELLVLPRLDAAQSKSAWICSSTCLSQICRRSTSRIFHQTLVPQIRASATTKARELCRRSSRDHRTPASIGLARPQQGRKRPPAPC